MQLDRFRACWEQSENRLRKDLKQDTLIFDIRLGFVKLEEDARGEDLKRH